MKNKSQGFTALTFVLFISAFLMYLALSHFEDTTIYSTQLQSSRDDYTDYFNQASCKAISELDELSHSTDVQNPVCSP